MGQSRASSILCLCALAVSCIAASAVEIPADKLSAYAPLPAVAASPSNPLTEEKIALGRMLYFEARLSRSHGVSCNTCHNLAKYGVDGTPTSTGFKGQRGDRNAPSVYNAAAQFAQFWDGRAQDVEAQARLPMLNAIEMGMPSEKLLLEVLTSIPEYVQLFATAFPGGSDPVTIANASRALGAFERKLMTPSRWDAFLKGDKSALGDEEKSGFLKFVDTGCGKCHDGPLVGGNSFKKLGAKKKWPDSKDPGRSKISRDPGDRFVFKVASLRNVAMTGPYFHNGTVAMLEDAIARMAEYQCGVRLSPGDVKMMAAWLNTLTGPLPEAYIQEPKLPPSTARTPAPAID